MQDTRNGINTFCLRICTQIFVFYFLSTLDADSKLKPFESIRWRSMKFFRTLIHSYIFGDFKVRNKRKKASKNVNCSLSYNIIDRNRRNLMQILIVAKIPRILILSIFVKLISYYNIYTYIYIICKCLYQNCFACKLRWTIIKIFTNIIT